MLPHGRELFDVLGQSVPADFHFQSAKTAIDIALRLGNQLRGRQVQINPPA